MVPRAWDQGPGKCTERDMCRLKLAGYGVVFCIFFAFCQQAHAWGCEGHQTVALIAWKNLNPVVAKRVDSILAASPIDKSLKRWCGVNNLLPIADSATWADDVRDVQKDTAPYHFVDIPLGAKRDSFDLEALCKSTKGCVVDALAQYISSLRSEQDPAKRADALRFVIHFVGDAHQPLHDADDSDRGGNCVPVTYMNTIPKEAGAGDYNPNLHHIWDTEMVQATMKSQHAATVDEFADYLSKKYQANLAEWQKSQNPVDWAWDAHALAETISYGKLPVHVPIEAKGHIESCTDNDKVSERRNALHENVQSDYQQAAEPIIAEQLAKAGFRLASVLNGVLGQ